MPERKGFFFPLKFFSFSRVYVCVKAKLTFVSFFSIFFLNLSLRGTLTNLTVPMKKSPFQTISWGGSGDLKVVNPLVWQSILVKYEVQTQFLNLPPITPIFTEWGQICPPPPGKFRTKNTGLNRVKQCSAKN